MGQPTEPTTPGWYPDPHGSPRNRYFDGNVWTNHYSPMPPAPLVDKRRSGRNLLITIVGTAGGILLAIFIVLVFVLHACGSAYEDMKKDPSADAPTVNLGTSFDVGGLSVSNMEVKFQHDLGSDGFVDTTAKGIYVVVTAHVTNNGTKAHGLDSMYQKLHIGAKEYQANPFASMGASSHIKTSVYPDPGFSDDVTFIFDVPQSSVSAGATASFTEKTVLNVSGGLNGEKPNEVNVTL
jgi:Protein of unknown function (DUF2510)/Domain of unknown function (DUF4352)